MAISILVTGANGFVGKALCEEALSRKIKVFGATRQTCRLSDGIKNLVVGDIDEHTNWQHALENCNLVIHLAARVHVMKDSVRPLHGNQ